MARLPAHNLTSPAALACFLLTAVIGLGIDLWTKQVAFERLAPEGVEWVDAKDGRGPRVHILPVRRFHVGQVRPGATGQETAEAGLGVRLKTLAEDAPRRALLAGNPAGGALVTSVIRDSPAGRAGLAEGDLIVGVNGQAVADASQAGDVAARAIAAVNARDPGQPKAIVLQVVDKAGSRVVAVPPDEEPVVVRYVPGWLNFQAMANQGAVFGIGQGQRTLFLAVSVAAIGFIVYLFATSGRQRFYQFILGLLLAGVLGNMYDRLALGYVRDMLHIFPGRMIRGRDVFPWIFNVADSLLCVGVALIFLYSLRGAPKVKDDEPGKADRTAPAADAAGT